MADYRSIQKVGSLRATSHVEYEYFNHPFHRGRQLGPVVTVPLGQKIF